MTTQQLEALVKMTPTKEEEEKLYNFDGNVDELDPAEKFLKSVLCISFSFTRGEVMLYRETFDDEVRHLRSSLGMIEVRTPNIRYFLNQNHLSWLLIDLNLLPGSLQGTLIK